MININIYYTTFQENAIKLEKILYYILFSVLYFIWMNIIWDVKWRSGKYRTSNQTIGFICMVVSRGRRFIWNYRKDKCSLYDNSGHNLTSTANKPQLLNDEVGHNVLRTPKLNNEVEVIYVSFV